MSGSKGGTGPGGGTNTVTPKKVTPKKSKKSKKKKNA